MSDQKTAPPTPTPQELRLYEVDVSAYTFTVDGVVMVLPPKTLAGKLSLDECAAILARYDYVLGRDNTGGKPPTGPMHPTVRLLIKAACNARAWHIASLKPSTEAQERAFRRVAGGVV